MTLQKETGENALHENGSATPKVVQMPLPPGSIEHSVWSLMAEHNLARVGWMSFVEQKLRRFAP